VDAYTDTGRLPYRWLRPVILNMHCRADVPQEGFGIVASGDRFRMEAMLQRFGGEAELLDAPEVPDDGRRVRQRLM